MKKNKIEDKDLIYALEFLKKTKDGKYSKIEDLSLQNLRSKIYLDIDVDEELYFYSVS